MKNKYIHENLSSIISTIVLVVANIWLYIHTRSDALEVNSISFFLVWLNLILGWLTLKKQPSIAYIFFSAAMIIVILMILNVFWISSRVM